MADNNIADITPAHEPIAVAREMVVRAPGCTAGVCILVKPDGTLWYDMAGSQRCEVLWALNRLSHVLMIAADEAGA